MKNANDPMGAAIHDYFKNAKSERLRVFSPDFEEDEIPVATLFRNKAQMSVIERKALEYCHGKILDVGAGSGCHSIVLKQAGKEVSAIDISPLSVQVMQERGLRAFEYDLFDPAFDERYDTILLLMNGAGIIGRIERLGAFFERMKQLLLPGGSVLMDSSDLKYLYEEEDGSFLIDLNGKYYGEIEYQMQYKDIVGSPFDWLYIDFDTLAYYAAQNGFKTELLVEGEYYDYLARLTVLP